MDLLRNRHFRGLWLGQSLSAVGDRIALIALTLYVTRETGSPTSVGLVLAASIVPLLLLLVLGGVWGDRLSRVRIMVAADLVRFAAHALLAVLVFADAATVPWIVAIRVVAGVAMAFFQPAYSALLPATVEEHEIQRARAWTSGSTTVADFLGPALATALVFGAGAGIAFAIDALTFLVSALLLARVRPRQRAAPLPRRRRSFLRDVAAGYREVRKRPWVRVTILVFGVGLHVGLAPWYVLGPTVAEDSYGSASVYGIAVTFVGAGSMLGAVVAARWRPARPLKVGLIAMLPFSFAACGLALGAPAAAVFALAAATGLGWTLFQVFWETALAERIPPEALARVSSYDMLGSFGLLPLGFLGAGPIAHALGSASAVLFGGAILFGVLMLVGLLPRGTRELTQLRAPLPGPHGGRGTPASPGVEQPPTVGGIERA